KTMSFTHISRLFLLGASLLALGGCAGLLGVQRPPSATVQLHSASGSGAGGLVSFVQNGDSVTVSGTARGLKPDREHGFHVHENGDCASPDAMSAGGHFNPGGQPHGSHAFAIHHAGDLPSLKSDVQGNAAFSFTSKSISVVSGINSIVGRSLIIHQGADDYTSQPAGNAGPRLACGVIAKS
ncbi:MAG: copper/zinc superoxide dismutase family protein, partial [Polaromonas sp.]|nr:copper/zinc superoxide dismutase family protein [Polaromonas sp.]